MLGAADGSAAPFSPNSLRNTKTMSQAETAKRITLLEAVEILDQSVRKWEDSDQEHYSTEIIDSANAVCAITLSGFPDDDSLVNLYLASARFAQCWHSIYIDGVVDDDGEAFSAFRDSLAALRESIRYAKAPVQTELEPVGELLEDLQNHPGKYQQIAAMYGEFDSESNSWSGPFFDAFGNVQISLIKQEGRDPGSVIKSDWVPPGLKRRREESRAISEARLNEIRSEFNAEQTKNSETVEGLLREGQFPDVIASILGMTEEQVAEIAEQLGIELNNRESLLAEAGDALADEGKDQDQQRSTEVLKLSGEALMSELLELYEDDNGIDEHQALVLLSKDNKTASARSVRDSLKKIREVAAES